MADRLVLILARRLAVAVAVAMVVGFGMMWTWGGPRSTLFLRLVIIAFSGTVAFSVFEVWPPRLPAWLRRWVLQVTTVGAMMPLTTLAIYLLSTSPTAIPFWQDPNRWSGWTHLTIAGLLVAPWTAVAAIVRQKDAFARDQELTFALERSELEREALDARLHLLQAQVAPHFLFNTLANVQALVDAGSPHASAVLRSLTAYLRAAVPLLDDSSATVERELQLVRPYLELMQMRMPDRLQYAMHIDPAAMAVRCPPTTLLTLVENAVRHGIDPSEEGGRIDIDVAMRGDRCIVRVTDTGAGLQQSTSGLRTGLTTLRERLELFFGPAAHLRLTSNSPRGAIAEIEMPARS